MAPATKHSQKPLGLKLQEFFTWFQAVTVLYFFSRYECIAIGMRR
jgi:hypothetical protein